MEKSNNPIIIQNIPMEYSWCTFQTIVASPDANPSDEERR
jgi:hypothetical protein